MLRAIFWTLVLLALPVLIVFLVQRPLAAAACPRCFGMEKLQDRIYVESVMPGPAREQAVKLLEQAEDRVAKFYGGMQHRPRVLFCATAACFQHIGGGGARVGSIGAYALMVSPEGMNLVLLSHELSHVELHGRAGVWRMFVGDVPAWFDEGTAVLVSDDPEYLAPPRPRDTDRCRADPSGDLPADPAEWRDQLQEDSDLYARAACRVDRWMISKDGPPAVPALLDKVALGTAFEDAYR